MPGPRRVDDDRKECRGRGGEMMIGKSAEAEEER